MTSWPSGSTNSTRAVSGCSALPPGVPRPPPPQPGSRRFSGRMPTTTRRPSWPRVAAASRAGRGRPGPEGGGGDGRRRGVSGKAGEAGEDAGKEVHRRRADEAGDEEVGRPLVDLERG